MTVTRNHAGNSLHHSETDPMHRNGHTPYPSTLVVSAPRSGLNLVRHVFESTGLRTPGKAHLLCQGPLAFHRTHWVKSPFITPGRTPLSAENGQPLYDKMLFLLRDPLEIFVRAYAKDLHGMDQYCDNLTAYDHFSSHKMMVRYDDLVTDDSVFSRMLSFMELDGTLPSDTIPVLRRQSVNWYQTHNAMSGGSQTLGSHLALHHHKRQLSRSEREKLTGYLHERLGELAHRYLGPWLE
jgi:hypothetical protein